MNKAQKKMKDWVISHIASPEKMTATDHKVIDLLIVGLPAFLGTLIMFALMSAVYLWVLNKYGLEKTLVFMLVGVIIGIGQISGAIKQLSEI